MARLPTRLSGSGSDGTRAPVGSFGAFGWSTVVLGATRVDALDGIRDALRAARGLGASPYTDLRPGQAVLIQNGQRTRRSRAYASAVFCGGSLLVSHARCSSIRDRPKTRRVGWRLPQCAGDCAGAGRWTISGAARSAGWVASRPGRASC